MGLEIIKTILSIIEAFFILYLIGYSTFLFISVIVGSSILYRQKKMDALKNKLDNECYVPVSIVVPAHNEEITVVDTVNSLLELNYKTYEIIVVDDGSVDDTSKKLIQNFNMHKVNKPINKEIKCKQEEYIYESNEWKVPITLIRKKNGGKADALNMGINISQYPYFICMDADSVLQYDSLENITRPILENDNIVACGGLIRISNGVEFEKCKVKKYKLPKNLLACMQVLEYDRSFLASRIMLDQFNGNLIISGAFGLFKKDVVVAVGGYDTKTVGEDMELVIKLHMFCKSHNMKYSIIYVHDAICWSQAPSSLKDLIKQRKRWHIGLFQSMIKHRQLAYNLQYGPVSFVSYIYFFVYELLSPIIELTGILTTVLAFAFNLINVQFMLILTFIYAVFGAVLSVTIFLARIYVQDTKLSFKDIMKILMLCLVENAGLRQILAFARMTALIGYRKKKLQWGDIKRVKQHINS